MFVVFINKVIKHGTGMRSVQIYTETNTQMSLHVTVTSERKRLFSLVRVEASGPGGARIHQTSNSVTENLQPRIL